MNSKVDRDDPIREINIALLLLAIVLISMIVFVKTKYNPQSFIEIFGLVCLYFFIVSCIGYRIFNAVDIKTHEKRGIKDGMRTSVRNNK